LLAVEDQKRKVSREKKNGLPFEKFEENVFGRVRDELSGPEGCFLRKIGLASEPPTGFNLEFVIGETAVPDSWLQ
jgi:hypothetical protein